jgi:hypothetical protein
MARIVVLVHENDEFDRIYLMHEVLEVSKERGHEVIVQRGLRGPIPEGDLVINHVDLTVGPGEYMAVLRRFPKSVNGRVLDISKRAISPHLVRRNDDFAGPVVVKGNLNSGGWREARIGQGAAMGEYHVYERKGLVPDFVWQERGLVVEKFLPEIEDDFFCLRIWFFCGDQRGHGICYSREPIIKLRNVEKATILTEPPPDALAQMREDLAFDFGKFDFGIVEGAVVLYDANRTPTLGDIPKENYINLVTRLANGLENYL